MGCSTSKPVTKTEAPLNPRRGEHNATLHAAAAIFRDEVLAGVGEENKALEDECSHLARLCNSIQEVKTSFYTSSVYRRPTIGGGGYTTIAEHHETFNVKTQVSDGVLEYAGGEIRLVIPIQNAPAHPVDDSGTFGSVKVVLGRMTIGSYPRFPGLMSNVEKELNDDDSVNITLHLSEQVIIKGVLSTQSPNDGSLIEYIESGDFMTYLEMPAAVSHIIGTQIGLAPSRSKGIMFTLTSVSLAFTPHLRAFLDISNPRAFSDDDMEPASELRNLVVAAFGESQHMDLLRKHLELKSNSVALAYIRKLILGIEIRHPVGGFDVSLADGYKVEYDDETPDAWVIEVDERTGSKVSVADFCRSEFSFSGMKLSYCDSLLQLNILNQIDTNGPFAPLPLHLHLSECPFFKFVLFGVFNWDDLSSAETSLILRGWSSKMRNALGVTTIRAIGGVPVDDDDVFPPSFKFQLLRVKCHLSVAQDMFNYVGLSESRFE